MEDMNLIDDSTFEGGMNSEMKSYLMETAKWGKFISIVCIVIGGLNVLVAIFAGGTIASIAQMSEVMIGSGLILGFYLFLAAMIIIPSIYLLNFSTKAISSLRSGSEGELTESFRNLKSYFKFVGIVLAIIIGLYALIFVIALLTSATAF